MNLLGKFREAILKHNLFSPKDKLLLAVSGGVDSVVLCELCKQAGFHFIIAHCNFQLREEESERDEKFVCNLGKKYGVEVLLKKFDTERYAAENKLSIQEAARDLRYGWFAELVNSQLSIVNSQLSIVNSQLSIVNSGSEESPIHHSPLTIHHSPLTIHLLTAHHADDNNETVLMNFFRGTGLHGLTGIPISAGHVRRPLLGFSKDELIDFAKQSKLEFVEDSSNQSSKYTRNFFRNEILPAIQKVYPKVKENLQDNINRYREIEKLFRFSVGELKKKVCKQRGNEVHIPVKQLKAFNNRALIYEIISPFGFHEKQVDEVVKLADSESGKFIQSPSDSYRIFRHRHWLIISPVQQAETENIIIGENDKEIIFLLGKLYMERTSSLKPQTSNNIATLDAKEISFPLLLRKWKTGDYFYPFGMKNLPAGRQGKKKISRFLIDQKLSKTEKEKIWVIESNLRIIWVVGYRIDERFKITEKTKTAMQLTFKTTTDN